MIFESDRFGANVRSKCERVAFTCTYSSASLVSNTSSALPSMQWARGWRGLEPGRRAPCGGARRAARAHRPRQPEHPPHARRQRGARGRGARQPADQARGERGARARGRLVPGRPRGAGACLGRRGGARAAGAVGPSSTTNAVAATEGGRDGVSQLRYENRCIDIQLDTQLSVLRGGLGSCFFYLLGTP